MPTSVRTCVGWEGVGSRDRPPALLGRPAGVRAAAIAGGTRNRPQLRWLQGVAELKGRPTGLHALRAAHRCRFIPLFQKRKKRKEKAQVRCLPRARCEITGARWIGEGSWCREAWRARSGWWWDVTSPEAESSVPPVARSPAATLGQHRVQ